MSDEKNRSTMDHSPQVCELAKAMAAAQGALKPAPFDMLNPHFGRRYASLSSIAESCRAALASNGIAVFQGTAFADGRVVVTTMVVHSSGQWMRDELSIKPVSDTPQAIGSALTYARRYSLCGMVGVVSEEDDDGNGKGQDAPKTTPKPKATQSAKTPTPPVQQAPQNHASAEPTPNSSAPELTEGAKIAREVDSIVAWTKRLRNAKNRNDVCRELSTLLARDITGAADLTDASERHDLLAWLASIDKAGSIDEAWQNVANANEKLRLDRESAQRDHEASEAKK